MVKLLSLSMLLSGFPLLAGEENDWDRVRPIAESRHEIVILLIKNEELNRVLPACKKLFSLNFPQDKQHLVVEAAKNFSDALIHLSRYDLADQIVDEAIKSVSSNQSKASLYREKGYIYVKAGKDGEAMECFEKAVQLESVPR